MDDKKILFSPPHDEIPTTPALFLFYHEASFGVRAASNDVKVKGHRVDITSNYHIKCLIQ